MSSVDSALLLFAFTMFPHILGASLVLGFSWLAFTFELIGRRTKNAVYVASSKAVAKGIVLTYATIGSLGTAITVELFVLWPGFMKILGVLLWWPFALAASAILLNFFLIAVYWYTFDRINAIVHVCIGFLMAVTSSLIPLNFRTIMAFTNQPVGLVEDHVEIFALYANPSLPPLYAHTLFASLSTAGFIVCAGAALAQHLNRGESHANSKLLRLGLVIGVGFLVPQALAGAWYLWTLGGNVPTMFAAITGLFAQYSCFPGSDIHLSDLFAVKLVIVGYLFLAGLSLTVVGERPLSGRAVSVAVSTAVLSSAVVMLGETMQEYSHLPYLVTGKFTVSELLTATFPLSMTTASTLIAGFGIFFVMLFAILYVAYVKR